MNELILSNTTLPIVSSCDFLAASEPFFHADRIADFHVCIYVTEGCIYVTEEETDFEIHAGNLLFLKSGIRHFGKTEIKRGTCWHFAHFYMDNKHDIDMHHALTSEAPQADFTESCPQPLCMTLPQTLRNLTNTGLEQEIINFTEYFHGNEPLRDWSINQRFFQLLLHIAHYEQECNAPFSLSDRIAQYLTNNYEQPFSAGILEQKFSFSYKHMAAVFKKEKQLTMQQYHTQVRMNIACKLLRSTLLPIGEISMRVGYSDMLYFSRCFHATVGMSPSEYRRQPHVY